jgi:hypothetical protein
MMHYLNPRLHAAVPDWPYGRDQRTTATFLIERHPTRGERAVRTTVDPRTGRASKPKAGRWSPCVRIVDGLDGRIYLLEDSRTHLTVMQGTMQLQAETIWPEDARYDALRLAMINTA